MASPPAWREKHGWRIVVIHSLIPSAFVHLFSHLHIALELNIIRTYLPSSKRNPREINGGFVRPQQPQPRPQSSPLPFISINL